MKKIMWAFALMGALCLSMPAIADDDCPVSVKASIERTFPGSVVKKCEKASDNGNVVYAIHLKSKSGDSVKMNLDPAGLVLVTQQYVTTDTVPVAVMKTFKGKYPDYKVVRTEKWTYPDGKVTYRVTYAKDQGRMAAIYTTDGIFVQEIEVPNVDEDLD